MPQSMPTIPKSVLHDIGEFTDGFFLIAITADGRLEVHDHTKNEIQTMAVERFMEVHIGNVNELEKNEFMDGNHDMDSSNANEDDDDDSI